MLAVYAVITQQDIGKLFMAGILPGLLAISMYLLTISLIDLSGPSCCRPGPALWPNGYSRCRDVWASLVLFVFVIGGLYGGFFTPTEAGGMGAGDAFLLGWCEAS